MGGWNSFSWGVLDIFYSVVIKMYYLVMILWLLFIVYLFVVEFDLVFKVFDLYFEFVKKGKVWVDKIGEKELGLDDDGIILEIML